MRVIRHVVLGLSALLGRRRAERDLDDELRAYLDTAVEQKVAAGMTLEGATRAARAEMGSLAAVKDYTRDAGWESIAETTWQDVRYAARTLRRSPGFTAAAVLTLALGVGANTAIFSVVNAVLLQPAPYPNADRFARLMWDVPAEFSFTRAPIRGPAGVNAIEIGELRSRVKGLSSVGTFAGELVALSDAENAPRLQGARVSAALLEALAVPPLHGRLPGAADEATGAEPVIVLSYGMWRRHFGGAADVVGRAIRLESVIGARREQRYTVVGVMPRGFEFPDTEAQFWMSPAALSAEDAARVRQSMVVRLADGVSPDAAGAGITAALRQMRSDERAGANATYSLVPERDDLIAAVTPALLVLTAAVAVVLLIACVNVANLMLARGAARRREMAIRSAIGAARSRLLRQAFTEGLVLSLAGAAAGIALAYGAIRLLQTLATTSGRVDVMIGQGFPRLEAIGLDWRVLWFTLGVGLFTGVLAGLVPALRQSRPMGPQALTDGLRVASAAATSRTETRNLLVIAQVGMAMVLLIGASLLMHSLVKLWRLDPGFDPRGVLTFQVSLPVDRYREDAPQQRFADSIVDRLQQLPGVEGAAYGRQLPMVQLFDGRQFRRTGVPPTEAGIMAADLRLVSRDYLSVMRMPLVAGRGFDERDGPGAPRAALINESLASRYFAGETAVGKTIFIDRESSPWHIVGVVGNVRQRGLEREPEPQLFVDFRQWTEQALPRFPLGPYFALRANVDPGTAIARVRQLARDVEPTATLFNVATMEQLVATTVARRRMYATLLGVFAAVGVALATIGIYGVMAYSVTQRTREIGVRVALGAQRSGVVRLVVRQSLSTTAIGISLGLAGAAVVTRYLDGMLFGLTPRDPATFVAVTALFTTVALAAALVPARRAARVDPMTALRTD